MFLFPDATDTVADENVLRLHTKSQMGSGESPQELGMNTCLNTDVREVLSPSDTQSKHTERRAGA